MTFLTSSPLLLCDLIHQTFEQKAEDSAVLNHLQPAEVLELDVNVRLSMWYYQAPQHRSLLWHQMDAGWLETHSHDLLARGTALYLLACHNHGRVRQKACELLGGFNTQISTALLLVRANDWVEPVREEAAAQLASRVTPTFLKQWLDLYPLLDRLGNGTRVQAAGLKERVHALISTHQGQHQLLSHFDQHPEGTRLALLPLMGWDPPSEKADQLVVQDPSPRIRRKAVAWVGAAALQALLKDPDVKVRELALLRAVQEDLQPLPVLEAALLDPRFRVRVLAQHHHGQLGNSPLDRYRKLAGQQLTLKEQKGLVAGLAELGTREDLPMLLQFAQSTQPVLRAEGLRGLGRLAPHDHSDLLEEAVLDVVRVSRVATESLKHADLVHETLVCTLWKRASTPGQRKRVLRLALNLPRYTALALLLEWKPDLAGAEMRLVVQNIAALLQGFGQRYYTRPSQDLQVRIRRAKEGQLLPREVLWNLRHLLGET